MLVHHSPLPSWPRKCLPDPVLGPYHITEGNGCRVHLRCTPHLGGELLCAPKGLRHYDSLDHLFGDMWRLSDKEVERTDFENASNPEEADELEEMIVDEMGVDG